MTTLPALLAKSTDELIQLANQVGARTPRHPWPDVLAANIAHATRGDDADVGCGVLEVHSEGFGFLRSLESDLLPAPGDIYVSQSQIRRFRLRTGDSVIGRTRAPKEGERYHALLRVECVNGQPPEVEVRAFQEHVAVHPTTPVPLARDPWLASMAALAPLGLGSRGLLIGPGAQRTELLRRLARAFEQEDDLDVIVLLVGERPEEVTEWRESTHVEVIAVPFEEPTQRQLHVTDIAFERARRLAERGREVLMIVDSGTRLARFCASDAAARAAESDPNALHRVRGWFATGRDLRDAGSVTLILTANHAQDDPGNVALIRELTELSTWRAQLAPGDGEGPAWDAAGTWTRHAERLTRR